MFGVSISPPHGSIAEKPTSSRTISSTLGAPSCALGCSYGPQSGTESLMSMLIVPLNGLVMSGVTSQVIVVYVHRTNRPGWRHRPVRMMRHDKLDSWRGDLAHSTC